MRKFHYTVAASLISSCLSVEWHASSGPNCFAHFSRPRIYGAVKISNLLLCLAPRETKKPKRKQISRRLNISNWRIFGNIRCRFPNVIFMFFFFCDTKTTFYLSVDFVPLPNTHTHADKAIACIILKEQIFRIDHMWELHTACITFVHIQFVVDDDISICFVAFRIIIPPPGW